MNDTNNSGSSGGIGFFAALFLVLLVLKLVHLISWSWWWVTAPLWWLTAFVVGIIIATFLGLVIGELGKAIKKKAGKR